MVLKKKNFKIIIKKATLRHLAPRNKLGGKPLWYQEAQRRPRVLAQILKEEDYHRKTKRMMFWRSGFLGILSSL